MSEQQQISELYSALLRMRPGPSRDKTEAHLRILCVNQGLPYPGAAARAVGAGGGAEAAGRVQIEAVRQEHQRVIEAARAAQAATNQQKNQARAATKAAGQAAAGPSLPQPLPSAPAAEEEPADEPDQAAGTDEAEDGHTYAAYESCAMRELNPGIMGHPGQFHDSVFGLTARQPMLS